MTQILSEDKIDQLLTAISSRDNTPSIQSPIHKNIRLWDWSRPDNLTREAIKVISLIHEKMCRDYSENAKFSLYTASVDQLTYEEFIRSVPASTDLVVLEADNLGKFFIEKDPSFNNIIPSLKNIIPEIGVHFLKAWNTIIELDNFEVIGSTTNPATMEIVSPNTMVCLVTVEISGVFKKTTIEGMLNFCYLETNLKKLNLTKQNYYNEEVMVKEELAKDLIPSQQKMFDIMSNVPVEISVQIGKAQWSLEDVIHMGEGTIIEVDKLAGEPVDILANGKPVAKGEVVVVDETFGVRVIEVNSRGGY